MKAIHTFSGIHVDTSIIGCLLFDVVDFNDFSCMLLAYSLRYSYLFMGVLRFKLGISMVMSMASGFEMTMLSMIMMISSSAVGVPTFPV